MSKDPNQKEAIIKAAYADVNKFGQNGEYEKAVKAVNRVLGVAPDDQTALHCKVVCLIQLSKFEEAYKFIEKNKLAATLVLEKAYCEYRLNKPEQALKTIDNADINPLPVSLKELRTQVLYRLERYEECFDAYREIIKNTNDDYENERRTNLSAVAANLAVDKNKEIPELPEETYEQYYNAACIASNRQRYAEAEKKLRASEKLCRETLEEDGVTEEEMREELEPIRVQLGYCLQMQGKLKEAAAIYAECLRFKPKDPVLVAVASNNSVVINKDQNVFDSKKKIRSAMSEACESKLTSRQKKAIALNNCLLAFFTNSSDQVQQLCQKLVETYPDLEFQTLLIRCSQLTKDKRQKEAVDLLNKYAAAHKENAFASKFAIVQLLLSQGSRKEAIDILLSLGEKMYKPGIISALVTLYLGTDNKRAASELLKSAVEWYKMNNVSSGDLSDMWRQAAEFHLRGGASETAASSLEELLKLNANDMKVLAQLVIAYAQFNPKRALELSKRLPKLETLTTASEIDALEAANWVMSTKAAKKTANAKIDQSPGTPVVEKKKSRNRKRKGKLPKNYNAEVPPDPERWLPKYERTGFRKKRDRRAKDIIKGSQGMASGAADQYDMSNRANLSKNSPATPVYQEPTPGPRQQHRKGGHKKKKGGRF
ncbi:signal recognition particle subunit SRP72-like [Rhagoletis pomonella]|uniref:signal recognition particle subunit SRP72-like n=1 Tax=Rhagoletis pomonella TaxID=28610 RepID=UPI001780A77B|nr:signal recognition particle subunit SRP72-like [Rhagoletis pomonella]XP_036341623.1 signal recognition particle subunit SRP72-like [Rhagoletis pomonella]